MKHFITTVFKILNRQEKVRLFTAIILDLVIGVLDIAFLAVLLVVINFYTSADGSPKHFPLQSLFNKNSLMLISIFFMLFGLKNWVGYRITKSQNLFFYDVASRLSKRNIWHYLKGGYINFVHTDSSVYIRKISQQPIEFSNYILTNIQQVVSQSILILFTITGLLFYHAQLFLSLFLLLVPPVFLLAFFIKKKLKNVRLNSKTVSQKTLQHLKESLAGFIESNVYEKNEFFSERYYGYQKQLNDNIAIQQTLQGLPSRLIEVFAVLGFLILIAINKLSISNHIIGLLDIGVFMAASYKIIPGIVKILNSTGQMKTYEFTLHDLLPAEEKTADITRPAENIHSVKFDTVSFKYKEHQVLNGLSFEICPGDFIGISGHSGRGKTTLINILLGFLQQDCGRIAINGGTLNADERQAWWGNISYVKQQPFFINDTVLKNITLIEDDYDTAKLWEAFTFCGIDTMLNKYPQGMHTMITENGKNISGGQRQRLSLARALYHDFDLLLLDEPFGELDEASESTILVKLGQLAKKGKMILMITHKKASLTFCNKIISLDGE